MRKYFRVRNKRASTFNFLASDVAIHELIGDIHVYLIFNFHGVAEFFGEFLKKSSDNLPSSFMMILSFQYSCKFNKLFIQEEIIYCIVLSTA